MNGDVEWFVTFHQLSRQFQYGFSRQDDFAFVLLVLEPRYGITEPVAVRGNDLDFLVFGDQQQSIQVIADVLLRHRVLHQAKQLARNTLGYLETALRLAGVRERRKIRSRQGLQIKAAFAGFDL